MTAHPVLTRHEEDWREASRKRAAATFSNQRLREWAAMLASTHQFAIEYIEQAPVIVLAASAGMKTDVRGKEVVCRAFGSLCERAPRLRDFMWFYHLPQPLRAVAGGSLSPSDAVILKHLADMNRSALALAIPHQRQRVWLGIVRAWVSAFQRRAAQPKHVHWATKAAGRSREATLGDAGTIVDMIVCGEPFHEEWTWEQAIAAAGRWHARLRLAKSGEAYGLGPDAVIDFAPHPDFVRVSGLTFHALRTPETIAEEGARMRHCVASYIKDVLDGRSHLVSVREGEKRVATLELSRKADRYARKQFKGPCNRSVTKRLWDACGTYIETINAQAA